jgi:hypothetical protein
MLSFPPGLPPLSGRCCLYQKYTRLSAALFNRAGKKRLITPFQARSRGYLSGEVNTDLPVSSGLHGLKPEFEKPFVWFEETAKSTSQYWLS